MTQEWRFLAIGYLARICEHPTEMDAAPIPDKAGDSVHEGSVHE